ncbi:hypothetical protein N0V93_006666 [Gnomoniopsis smithogilvyi]|uniref:Uncharacterized protein n=1 Tax=Gnomoniopsis smithogilvyi TaxID=1191159 RepID=A0A9W8YS45_9PEZI|nr:hypothetical protein N0V93_006666 [Gnomoniopsis smithogilvyi]
MNSTVGGATLAAPGAATANATYYQAATQSNITAATAAISNALKFATSKSIRTSTIILASFNAFAAFITAVGIIHSCRQYNKRMQRRASDPSVLCHEWKAGLELTQSRPPSGLFFIHTVEVFPLLLSLGTTVQSITFAAAQSVGLQALLSRGCTIVAIFMLPALFLVPFTHLVFGVEAALRGIRSNFAPRGKWNITICLAIVGAMTLVTLIVAIVEKAPDFCFASLFWFIRTYSTGGFAVFVTVATLTLIVMGTIFLKLNRSRNISPTERVAASRMIYYLALGFISEVFIIPFFFSITFLDQEKVIFNTLNLGMVASVVANVNGLMVAGLHLFLRSQNNNSICQDLGEYERKNSMYDPRDGRDNHRGSNHSLQPVNRSNSRARSDSSATLLHATNIDERGFPSPMSYGTARSPFSPKLSIPSGPAYPEPTQPPSETSPSQIRKQSYSLYPNDQPQPAAASAAAVLPATTYSPMATKPTRDTWKPPPIVKPWMGRGHKRDSSITSTATVQIGIRLSNVDDYIPRKSTDTDVPDVPDVPDPRTMPTIRSSQFAEYETRTVSDYSDYAGTDIILADPPSRPSSKDSRMKTLPPVPRSPATAVTTDIKASTESESEAASDDEQGSTLITLSPTVYQDPVELSRSASNRSLRKLPSPLGVGFSTPTGRGPSDPRLAAVAPPRPSGSAATTPIPTTKADWI